MDEELALGELSLAPIGSVRNGIHDPRRFDDWQEVVSDIVVNPELEEALDGVEGYSHLVIIFYFSRELDKDPKTLKIHPKGREDLPVVGVFATRSQFRPNPIGLSTPRLVKREGRILRVQGLDALDGTPVLDIKGVSVRRDCPPDLVVPDWVEKL